MLNKDLITVVIPCRVGEAADCVFESLYHQTFLKFSAVVICDNNHGANWARNVGFGYAHTPFVLFSDNDITWHPKALHNLYQCLEEHPEASYAYGSYLQGTEEYCNMSFDSDMLTRMNYISTMSLIRVEHFPRFDEKIQRLQDWDLWLTMATEGHFGVSCNHVIFTTPDKKSGITFNGKMSMEDAVFVIKYKHRAYINEGGSYA